MADRDDWAHVHGPNVGGMSVVSAEVYSRYRPPAMNELVGFGADSLPRFFARWYGPPPHDYVPVSESAQARLPDSLRRWYELRAAWLLPCRRHNEMIPADQLEAEDAMVVFWVGIKPSPSGGIRRATRTRWCPSGTPTTASRGVRCACRCRGFWSS
jgi:hypothetical protein